MLQTPLDVGKMTRPESAPKTRILIVEKHSAVRRALRKRLSATPDLDVPVSYTHLTLPPSDLG